MKTVLALAAALLASSVQAGETLDRVTANGAMVVATNSGWPPQSYLSDEGVLIVGSGMSFHNLRARGPQVTPVAAAWDAALTAAVTDPDPARRAARVIDWESLPHARFAHPEAEHLLRMAMLQLSAMQDIKSAEMLVNEAIIDVAVGATKFRGEYTGGMPTIGCPGCNGETMEYVEQEP